jgi:hypothetical protein
MKRRRPKKSKIPKDSFDDEKLKEFIENEYPELGEVMIPLGLSSAFIGICTTERERPCLVYDASRIIEVLMQRDEMTRDEAIEFFEYNIESVKTSEGNHPLYIWGLPPFWMQN